MNMTRIARFFTFLVLLASSSAFLFAQQEGQEGIENLSEPQKKLYQSGFGVPKNPIEAPDFTLERLSGGEVSLGDYEGQVVLLNLWATWCPPCRAEMPSMQDLYDQLSENGFTILAVAAPNTQRESLENIESYIEENNFTFPVLLDTQNSVFSTYGTGSIPTSWIVGPDGMLLARLRGKKDWTQDSIVSALEMLME